MSARDTVRTVEERAADEQRRREAKLVAAQVLDASLRALDLDATDLAEDLGVSPSRAKRLRSTDRDDIDVVLSAADLLLMRPALREEYLARHAVEAKRFHAPTDKPVLTPERALMQSLRADAEVQHVSTRVLEDGVLDPAECPEMRDALLRRNAASARALELVERRGRR